MNVILLLMRFWIGRIITYNSCTFWYASYFSIDALLMTGCLISTVMWVIILRKLHINNNVFNYLILSPCKTKLFPRQLSWYNSNEIQNFKIINIEVILKKKGLLIEYNKTMIRLPEALHDFIMLSRKSFI